MFVCLLLNTRRHARYRWPPPKLCSAIILKSQYWSHANVINDVRNASSKRLCHGCLLHCVHVASYGIYSNKRRPRLSSTPSSDTQGQSVWSGEKAGWTFSSTVKRATGGAYSSKYDNWRHERNEAISHDTAPLMACYLRHWWRYFDLRPNVITLKSLLHLRQNVIIWAWPK